MTEEFIKEYLGDNGLFFSAKSLFVDPVKEQMKINKMAQASGVVPQSGNVMQGKKDINTMPSRQKSVDKNKKGTGQESSTRENQLKKV